MKLTALIFLASSMVALAAPTERQHLVARGGEAPRQPVEVIATCQAAGQLLDRQEIDYAITGGAALVLHGLLKTRKTGDVDIFVPEGSRSEVAGTLLTDDGFTRSGRRVVFLADEELSLKHKLGKPRAKVEVPLDIAPILEQWFTRPAVHIKGVKVISLLDLLNMKCSTSRLPSSPSGKKDLNDMETIAKHLKKKGILSKANYQQEVPACASEGVVRAIMSKK